VWLEKHDNNNNGESDLNNFAWSAGQPAVLKEEEHNNGTINWAFPGLQPRSL